MNLARAYRPLHLSFLFLATCYYSYVTIAHFTDETGTALATLAGLSFLTAMGSMTILVVMSQVDLGRITTETVIGLLHVLMLANVAGYQFVHFEPFKLVYFPLLAVAFAISAISPFMATASVLISIGSMLWIVWSYAHDAVGSFTSIAVATAVTALGLSTFLRGVIGREVQARLLADERAEHALEAARENARLANSDVLTGLVNRRGFFGELSRHFAATDRQDRWAVGIVDLDGFKAINDIFGHGIGDRVLVDVAARLMGSSRRQAIVGRLGGDEFGIIVDCCDTEGDLRTYANSLVSSLRMPFSYEGVETGLSASCGFTFAQAGDTTETALDRADFAVRAAKKAGRGTAVVFSADHFRRIETERALERALLHADLFTEIVPVFQPIVDIETGEPVGYEALARWNNPELGMVSPADFVPLAERLGLISTITRAMTRHALAVIPVLADGVRVSVNLSPYDLASSEAVQALSNILAEGGERPCGVDFEVTETAVMQDVDEANEALLKLMAHGARISLDDFGTGHSSLVRVRLLPLNRIKIDRSFIIAIERDLTSQAIVRTTLDLCRNLGVTCVIEGIETPHQLAVLRGLGARYFQGYLFGRPVAANDIVAGRRPAERLTA